VDDDRPWCFFSGGPVPGECTDINWDNGGGGSRFTQADFDAIYANFVSQLKVQDEGAVIASPDDEPDYYFHWMRDAALSIKTFLDLNDDDYAAVAEVADAYLGWVELVQGKNDPNGIDVRVEPKFEVPSGEPFTGGWCRPQNDGPSLRAMAVAQYGNILLDQGLDDEANRAWELVLKDIEWVLGGWADNGCDLWEEIQSTDFFWNRMGYVFALFRVADFAERIGEDGDQYRNLADTIRDTIPVSCNIAIQCRILRYSHRFRATREMATCGSRTTAQRARTLRSFTPWLPSASSSTGRTRRRRRPP